MKYPKNLSVFLGMSFLLLLTSCLNTSIKITFQTLESGTLEVTYTVPYELMGLSAPGGRGILTQLPTSRGALDALASPVQNLTVTGFSDTEVSGGRAYTINFRFATLRALEGLFVAAGQRLTVIPNQGTYTLTQVWENLEFRSMDKKTKDLVTALYGGAQVSWEITAPRNIASATEGTISDDRRSVKRAQTWNTLLGVVIPGPWRVLW